MESCFLHADRTMSWQWWMTNGFLSTPHSKVVLDNGVFLRSTQSTKRKRKKNSQMLAALVEHTNLGTDVLRQTSVHTSLRPSASPHSSSQSAPTIFVLKTWVCSWPWKKSGPNIGLQKSGWKKAGSFEKSRCSLAFFFLNNNNPVFCTLLFATHTILDRIFLKFQILKTYQVDLIN